MAGNPVSLIPRDYIRLTVRNQGTGIAFDNLIKIFDPYFTTQKSGSGQGLSVAHCIIEKHEGRITASSTPGEETFLPSICRLRPINTRRYPMWMLRVEAGMGHVLVMGYETYIRELTAVMLKRLEYSVSLAADGGEAVRLYELSMDSETPVDAVILDLTVPGGMGGIEAITRLQAIDPDVETIVSSGYSNDPVMAVKKPYMIHEMSQALSAVLTGDEDA